MAEIDNHEPQTNSKEEQLRTRVELTRRWILRGIKSAEDIQEQFKALAKSDKNFGEAPSIRSVYRYIGIVKEEGAKAVREREGLNKTMDEMAIDLKNVIDEVARELWKQYHAPSVFRTRCPHPDHKGDKACGYEAELKIQFGQMKVQALKEIRVAAKEWVEMMQDLGLAYKAPEKHVVMGPDGKPLPALNINIDKAVINQEFISYIKSKFQKPVGQRPFADLPEELKPKN